MHNQVMRTILERRSCRSFAPDKSVSEQDLFTVLKAGAYAPSAMNTQSWHFTAVVNAEKLRELNALDSDELKTGQKLLIVKGG